MRKKQLDSLPSEIALKKGVEQIISKLQMDLIQAYQDEGSDSKKAEGSDELPQPVLKKMHVNVAPEVAVKRQV